MTLMGLTGGVPRWTPAALFAAGQMGAWYDPSDRSTMFKDVAGTIPVTADGDLVARIDDKSGNGKRWLQATSTLRPVYRTAGGLHWLETDGVDDFMSTDAVFATLGVPLTLMAAASSETRASASIFSVVWIGTGGGTGGANSAFGRISLRPDTNRISYVTVRGAGLIPPVSAADTAGGSLTYTTPVVITGEITSSGSQRVRTGGVVRGSGTNTWTTQTVTGAALVMGGGSGSAPGGGATPLVQKYYSVVAILDALPSEMLTLSEAWLASKAGVTL